VGKKHMATAYVYFVCHTRQGYERNDPDGIGTPFTESEGSYGHAEVWLSTLLESRSEVEQIESAIATYERIDRAGVPDMMYFDVKVTSIMFLAAKPANPHLGEGPDDQECIRVVAAG
jgi:hypothetical protein